MRLNKTLFGAIALGAVLTFAGCSTKDNNTQTTEPTTGVTTEATTETTTEATTEAPTDTTQPSSGDASSDGTDATEPGGQEAEHSEEMNKIHEAVVGAYEHYIPNMAYDADTAKELFGLQPEWYDDMLAEGPMISAQVDTFIAVHPTEGNLKNVEDALKAYRETLVNDTMQYPMNQVKIQASRVETVGDYVFFIMLGEIDMDIEEEAAMVTAYEAQNQLAVDAIKGVLGK